MVRGRGRPPKLDENKIERIQALRNQKKSYSAIASDIGVSKRLLLYWSARGRGLQSGLHREVYLALGGAEEVKLPPPSPPILIVAIERADIRVDEGCSWRRDDLEIDADQINKLRKASNIRHTAFSDPYSGEMLSVEVCTPKADAELTDRERELVAGLLDLKARNARGWPLLVEFQPNS
jgi:hypothetical protein